jgi:hypothetical protein
MKTVKNWWATVIGAALAAGVGVGGFVGCGTTNNINTGGGTSGAGESCTRTFDCKSGLVCLQNYCVAEAEPATDGGTVDGGDGGGTVIPTGPHLGLLNESCQTSADCESPLACLGNSCKAISYNLTSTGKSCTGECNMAADCCELPANFDPFYFSFSTLSDAGTVLHPTVEGPGVRCEDILSYIVDPTLCSAATIAGGDLAQACFDYNTYCKCGANTWSCTSNQCVYAASCSTSISTVQACPSETRTGRGLSSTCNVPSGSTTGSCQAGCAAAADCSGKFPTGASHACNVTDAGAGDCTCYQSACYFKCSKDLDCASGSTCDATTSLCKKAGCSSNADCVQSTANPQAQCNMGACQVACKTDVECSPPSTICSNGFCTAAGCSSDANCTGTNHMFCVTAAAATSAYAGAVTN